MKKLFSMFAMLAFLVGMAACSKDLPEVGKQPLPTDRQEIVIRAEMADFTRATDTAFEEGDEMGLFVLLQQEHLDADPNVEKTYVENARFVADADLNFYAGDLNGDGVVNEFDKLFWYEGNYQSTVVAYYPYQDNWDDLVDNWKYDVEFTVNADQSTHARYTASDLMGSVVSAYPSEEALALPFKHLLSKVVITVDNQLGEELADVYVANVLGSVALNVETLTTSVKAQGSKGTIKTAPVATRAEQQWVAIVAPQADAQPELIVTTVSEKQYTYSLKEAVTFESGKQLNAALVLSENNISTAFTPTITDWTDDNELNFKRDDEETPDFPAEEKWGVVGDFNGWGTVDEVPSDVPMSYSAGVYTAEVTLLKGQAFKFRRDYDWTVNRGSGITNAEGYYTRTNLNLYEQIPAAANGGDIFVSQAGVYALSWNAVEETISYQIVESVDDNWGLVGSFAASNWETDLDMTFVVDGTTMYYTVEADLTAGDEVKFRQNDSWEMDFGLSDGGSSIELATRYGLARGGANISIPATGTYTINFYLDWQAPTFELLCENPTYPEIVDPEVPDTDLKLYAHSEDGWTKMNLWAWDDAGANYSGGTWPGVAITSKEEVNGVEYFVYTFGEELRGKTINIIFNNGSAQTQDMNGILMDGPHYFKIVSNVGSEVDPETYTGDGDETETPEMPVSGARSEWGIVGALNGWAAPDIAMYTTETDGVVVAENVQISAFSEFKFRTNENWGNELTSDITGIQPNSWVVAGTGSGNTSVSVEGTYDIYLDTKNKRIYVMEPGVEYTTAKQQTVSYVADASKFVWGVVGDHNGWGTTADPVMTWDGAQYYVAYDLPLEAGKGFKVRADNAWNNTANYGVSAGKGNIAVGSYVDVYTGGDSGNIIVPATGTYDVYFDLAGLKVWLMTPGTKPAN